MIAFTVKALAIASGLLPAGFRPHDYTLTIDRQNPVCSLQAGWASCSADGVLVQVSARRYRAFAFTGRHRVVIRWH